MYAIRLAVNPFRTLTPRFGDKILGNLTVFSPKRYCSLNGDSCSLSPEGDCSVSPKTVQAGALTGIHSGTALFSPLATTYNSQALLRTNGVVMILVDLAHIYSAVVTVREAQRGRLSAVVKP